MAEILVVDDEPSMREFLEIMFRKEGHDVLTTDDGREAIEWVRERDVDLVLQDLKMPKMSGLKLLQNLKGVAPDLPVIIITAFSTWDNTVEAMRLGAYDFVTKPFDTDSVRSVVGRALMRTTAPGEESDEAPVVADMVGNTPRMREIMDVIKRVAPTDSTILVSGESGTGKELVARAIHYNSLRGEQPFIVLNCGAFPENLLESELFGHKKGAFTGAHADKRGLFEVADGGTLFLDEIGEMPLSLQVKLLRVLEERKFFPVGATEPSRVDVRFVTATNKNLIDEVETGRFRHDLYYRLNVIPLRLPPLRERRDDIPLLAAHFMSRYAKRMGKEVSGLSGRVRDKLLEYDWPGNVRELENVIQRAIALSRGKRIEDVDLPSRGPRMESRGGLPPIRDPFDLEETLAEIEKQYLCEALDKTQGNLTRAADLLGISFRSIRYKVKKYNLRE